MLIYAHHDERIVPAADNRAMIQALQNGSHGTGRPMNIEVHNNNGSKVELQHMSDDRVRQLINDEMPAGVAKHAPGVIAGEISNPNGKVSKALTRQTFTTRRR